MNKKPLDLLNIPTPNNAKVKNRYTGCLQMEYIPSCTIVFGGYLETGNSFPDWVNFLTDHKRNGNETINITIPGALLLDKLENPKYRSSQIETISKIPGRIIQNKIKNRAMTNIFFICLFFYFQLSDGTYHDKIIIFVCDINDYFIMDVSFYIFFRSIALPYFPVWFSKNN